MSVGRKIFISYSALIILMGSLFLGGTYTVVTQLIQHLAEETQDDNLNEISHEMISIYSKSSGWDALLNDDTKTTRDGSLLIKDAQLHTVASRGTMGSLLIEKFGLKRSIVTEDDKVWTLYYVNPVIHFVGLFRYAFRDSLTIILSLAMVALGVISIVISYYLARHLTSPIRRMIPVIDDLAKGHFQIKVPAASSDEYGRIASALNNMSSELEQSVQVRKNLTADIAHELRTPLAIVSGKLEYLQQRNQSVAPEELLPLQDELIRLRRLVNELRELALAEAGQLPLHKECMDIGQLLARIVDKVSFEAEEQEIAVYMHETAEQITCMVDKNRMTQVFLNIILNAIRYTPSGGEVRVKLEFEEGHKGHALITIEDNGIGIEPEHLPYLFQRFYRTDQARDRDQGGTGLGLAIAAEFVRAHKGDITVDSEQGCGSIFRIRIPCDRC